MKDLTKAIDNILDIAMAEVGYLEKKSDKDLYSKTGNAGYNNYTKYGKEMHELIPSIMDYPAYWCASFVSWLFYAAFGFESGKAVMCGIYDDYTVNQANAYKKAGRWVHDPIRGDHIFFKNSTRICHTGIVYKTDKTYVYTVEGNTNTGEDVVPNGGGVFLKKYRLDNPRIAGYGRPKYELVSDEIVESSRPDAKISVGKEGLLVLADLNIRNNAGTNGTLVVGSYDEGAHIFPTKKRFVGKDVWYHTDRGWISAKYVTGWVQEENGKWWMVHRGYHCTINNWEQIDNKWYYMDEEGYIKQSAWIIWKEESYYLSSDGSMATNCYVQKDEVYKWISSDGVYHPDALCPLSKYNIVN